MTTAVRATDGSLVLPFAGVAEECVIVRLGEVGALEGIGVGPVRERVAEAFFREPRGVGIFPAEPWLTLRG